MSTVYCQQWNLLLAAPTDPISEPDARVRFEQGPWFSVVLDGERGVPRAAIELQPGPAVAKVFLFTPAGSIDRISTFRRAGDRLRVTDTTVYRYADDDRHLQSDSTVIESVLFKPDGTARRVCKDKTQASLVVEDCDGVVAGEREVPVPAFGNWEPLVAAGAG